METELSQNISYHIHPFDQWSKAFNSWLAENKMEIWTTRRNTDSDLPLFYAVLRDKNSMHTYLVIENIDLQALQKFTALNSVGHGNSPFEAIGELIKLIEGKMLFCSFVRSAGPYTHCQRILTAPTFFLPFELENPC